MVLHCALVVLLPARRVQAGSCVQLFNGAPHIHSRDRQDNCSLQKSAILSSTIQLCSTGSLPSQVDPPLAAFGQWTSNWSKALTGSGSPHSLTIADPVLSTSELPVPCGQRGQATSCVSDRRVLEGPRNSCILLFTCSRAHSHLPVVSQVRPATTYHIEPDNGAAQPWYRHL